MAPTQTPSPGLFTQWYAAKRWYRLALCRRGCPLTLPERVVYSYAWYRTRYGGATVAEVARATGLDPGRTVPKARRVLTGHGLLAAEGRKLVACPPPAPDWFVWWDSRKSPGQPRQAWLPVCHSPPGWTVSQTAVYFTLLCNNVQEGRRVRRHQKKAGVAAMLGLSHDTVERAWRKFEGEGLLEYGYLRPPPPEVLARFPDRPVRADPAAGPWAASVACGWPFGTMDQGPAMARWMDESATAMARRGYSRDEVVRYWDGVRLAAQKDDRVLWWFMANWRELFDKVEADTRRNREAGKYKGRNSFGLLLDESRRRVGQKKLFGGPLG